MKLITMRILRQQHWSEVYGYQGVDNQFKVFATDQLQGLTIVHDFKKGRRTKISYRVAGRTTDSPSVAVKWWNEAERSKTGAASQAGRPKGKGATNPAVRKRTAATNFQSA